MSTFSIPYVTAVRYSAKEVVDEMLRLFLSDLRGGSAPGLGRTGI